MTQGTFVPIGQQEMGSKSLSEQLADISNPVPTLHDPEDDIYEETHARLADLTSGADAGHADSEGEETAPSALRRRVDPLLADQDPRYAGKAVSRSNLMDASDGEGSADNSASADEHSADDHSANEHSADEQSAGEHSADEDAEEEEEEQLAAFKAKLNGVTNGTGRLSVSEETDTESEQSDASLRQHSGDAGIQNEVDDDNDDDEEKEEDDGMSVEDEEAEGDVALTSSRESSEVEKGAAVRAQLGIWDQLLECRIKLQPCLQLCNQLPTAASWQPFWSAANQQQQLPTATAAADTLAKQLLQLQATLLARFPETSRLESGLLSTASSIADDSLLTDERPERRRRRRHPETGVAQAARRFSAYKPYRDATIQRWNDRTRITAGKPASGRAGGSGRGESFAAFQQSTLHQIEQIMSDRERLVRRTQLHRSAAVPLGSRSALLTGTPAVPDGDEPAAEQPAAPPDHVQDYDPEIFDDTDFYHQLLRELIERKSVDVTDPLALGKQWIQMQKLRAKVKKRVDTRASKGRKVRYEVYPKLVNFLATRRPVGAMSDAARDELFSSLFGQKRRQTLEEMAAAESA